MPVTSRVTVASFPAKDNGRTSMANTARAVLLVFMADTSAADYIATWDPPTRRATAPANLTTAHALRIYFFALRRETGLSESIAHGIGGSRSCLAGSARAGIWIRSSKTCIGLAMLRRSWINLDLIWAVALVVTGFVALLV